MRSWLASYPVLTPDSALFVGTLKLKREELLAHFAWYTNSVMWHLELLSDNVLETFFELRLSESGCKASEG